MNQWQWNGARWWKIDFHAHTPASLSDYGTGPNQAELKERAPREWLLDYMRAEIDCVAVTDHNSGAWIDQLKAALDDLKKEKPSDYRSLHLFPGVEISVYGGVHLLAILDIGKSTADIDSLLGAAGFPSSQKGSSDAVTSKSFNEVVEIVAKAGGIAIPAHVDGESGLFKNVGVTLSQNLDCKQIIAMEVLNQASAKPQCYVDKGCQWTEVLGSDAHHPSGGAGQRYPGSHFCWVKMGTPSLEGLRLALLDGALSVRRSDQMVGDPNEHASLVLESIEVEKARFLGRAGSFKVSFNPWLNTIVGGRGTGKSTIVEFLRIALRREAELPESLQPEFEKYGKPYPNREDGGLLTDEAVIEVIYRKNETRYCIQWSPQGDLAPILEARGDDWESVAGDIVHRFPVRIYSQKQVFELAGDPLALLHIVDQAPQVDRQAWDERRRAEEAGFLSLRAKIREVQAGFTEEPRLQGELDDLKRKLTLLEKSGHAGILQDLQKRTRQQRTVESWEEGWQGTADQLRELAAGVVPDPLDETVFDPTAEEDVALLAHAATARAGLEGIAGTLSKLAGQAEQLLTAWRQNIADSAWRNAVAVAAANYGELQERLKEEGLGDSVAYGELVQRRQVVEQRLRELADRKRQIGELSRQTEESLRKLLALRRELTVNRRTFLDGVLQGNPHVRIRVLPYGARQMATTELRKLLQRESGFGKDIGDSNGEGLLGRLYDLGKITGTATEQEPAEKIEHNLARIKSDLDMIAQNRHDPASIKDQRFAKHIIDLPPEALDRLALWFPEDFLEVRYSPTGDGQRFRSIQEGSPGQKTAALLAFLLSYGDEPLILDQPEDDLDNHLIYDLIVTQLREVKRRRQVIVVTHNANIVVNGDAELVIALAARGGETQKECEGSLQEKVVRETICTVMEGGRTAFEQRYRRIALEGRHV